MEPECFVFSRLNISCPKITAPTIDGRIEEGEWAGATKWTDFAREDGGEVHSKTTAWIGRDEGYLYIAVRCDEQNTEALRRTNSAAFREIHSREHVDIYISPEHDHASFRRYTVAPFDQTETARGSYRIGYRANAGSRWFHTEDQTKLHPMYFRYASAIEEGKCWSFEMAVPFESLETDVPEAGTVWGLNIIRTTSWPAFTGPIEPTPYPFPYAHRAECTSIAARPGYAHVNPLIFADLHFDAQPVQLKYVDFGVPHFGWNKSQIQLGGNGLSKLALITTVRPAHGGRVIEAEKEWPIDSDGKSDFVWKAFHYDDTNRLEMAVKERESGRIHWRGSYEFGWESGSLPLYYLHKGETGGKVEAPDPSDPDFLVKKACWIASRQYRFHRKNTNDGAPSDFTIESSDGSVRFNLMDTQCLDEIGKYIYDVYDNDTDRLVGMLFFAGQPAVIRAHPAYDWRTSDRLETMSLLRFASGYCGHMARVMSVMINRMHCEKTGQFHKARLMGIGGHGLVLVEYRDDYAILDSKHVTLYYKLDNSDLATLKELREQPEIGRRAYPFEMPALLTFNRDFIAEVPCETVSGRGLVWP